MFGSKTKTEDHVLNFVLLTTKSTGYFDFRKVNPDERK